MEINLDILLVEDDPDIANLIQRGLSIEGFQVNWVSTAQEAITAVDTHTPELAILDLGLPDMGGLSVCRAWRRQQRQLPILILSAKDSVNSKVAGLDAGADDYLTKPFDFEELNARLRALTRRKPSSKSDQTTTEHHIHVTPLSLNEEMHEITLNDRLLELTEREFLLLSYLMKHAGQVVTREQILNFAWRDHIGLTDNAVDVYISYLRRKIELHSPRLIHTVRGIGFKLKAMTH